MSADKTTKTDVIPAPLENSHAGLLLSKSAAPLALSSGFSEFDDAFGEALQNSQTAKAFAAALYEAKVMAGAIYIKNAIGPAAKDHQNQPELGKFWSTFADWCIDRTLRFVWQMPTISRHFASPIEAGDTLPGFFVLGLGKLGGQDLNYSSDVDLVAFFEIEDFKVRENAGRTDVAVRALKALTQILTGSHGPRIWRVDWRLRPDPSVTGLAMSAEAGLDFFFFHAAPWRRLAMMKARACAGDVKAGQNFLRELTPFIWRKTLDFRAIDEIGAIKIRIRDEHPGLDTERSEETPLETLENFNVKLGTGGIREIEFIANGLQLVWGGRQTSLRTCHTLTALRELEHCSQLTEEETDTLIRSYTLLRGLENRIQLIDDAQTHEVPSDRTALFALYEQDDHKALEKQFLQARQLVHELFQSVFSDQNEEHLSLDPSLKVEKSLSKRSHDIIEIWNAGFGNYGVSLELAPKLMPLSAALNNLIAQSPNPDDIIEAVDIYLRKLPPGGQYLLLLANNPELVRDILSPLTSGGAMARLLNHSPHVVDTLIQRSGQTGSTKAGRSEHGDFVFKQRDYESRLEAMRLHVNEMLYLAYLSAWRGEISASQCRELLTKLAREALQKTLKLVAEEYNFPADTLSIAAYGKLGMEEMMPESDLDIVFIAHGENSMELAEVQQVHKFATRLKTALSTEMRGGRIYEIDTRLRPSGASGAPTVRLATLENHQLSHAKTWEHLALVPARFGIGPDFAQSAFDEVRRLVLTKHRNQKQLVRDAHSMLDQLRTHRITKPKPGTIELKLMPGGLMEAEYLTAFLVLKHAANMPEMAQVPYRGLADCLEQEHPEVAGLSGALTFLQNVHFYERLYGWTGLKIEKLNLTDHPINQSNSELEAELLKTTNLISRFIAQEITSCSGLTKKGLTAYREERVVWAIEA